MLVHNRSANVFQSKCFLIGVHQNFLPPKLIARQYTFFISLYYSLQSSLKAVSPSEKFNCSLGIDPAIKLTISPIKKLRGQTGMISKSVSISYQHVFEVKNTKQEEIKVTLSEQLPLSTDERIKVRKLCNVFI